MKITNVIPYPIWIGSRNQLLVKIETDSDVFGWGESGLSARELGVSGIIEHYKDIIVGMDPFEIGKVWQRLYRSQYFEGGRTLTAAISAIDAALGTINTKRAGLGDAQTKLENVLSTAQAQHESYSTAISSILDVDYAEETANMTRFQIMQQAGVAALGQARSIPQSILSLLG